jgi:hypothetical protein
MREGTFVMHSGHLDPTSSDELDEEFSRRNFFWFWRAQALSVFTGLFCRELLPLIALISLAASSSDIGLMRAIAIAASLIFSPLAGAWCDRGTHRKVIWVSNVGRVCVLALLSILGLLEILSIPVLFVIVFGMEAFSSIFAIADNSSLPLIVGRKFLYRANAKLETTAAVSESVGPGLSAVLLGLVGGPKTIAVPIIALLLANFALIRVKFRSMTVPEPEPGSQPAAGSWQLMSQDLRLRYLFSSWLGFAFFGSFIGTLYLPYCLNVLNFSPEYTGLTVSAGGVGALVGAMFAPRIARHVSLGRSTALGLLLAGVAYLLLVVVNDASPTALVLVGLAQFIGDFFLIFFFVGVSSMRQAITPETILGRVTANFALGSGLLAIVGALTSGYLAQIFGFRLVLSIAIAGLIVASFFILFPKAIRE